MLSCRLNQSVFTCTVQSSQSKQGAAMAKKNFSFGRNLQQIQTSKSRHLPINNWGEKEKKREKERSRQSRRHTLTI